MCVPDRWWYDAADHGTPEMMHSTHDEIFAPGALSSAHAAELRRQYLAAPAFPHVVIDGLFSDAFLERALDDFRAGFGDWIEYRSGEHHKRATRPNAELAAGSRAYFDAIHRGAFTQFLSTVTAIDGLLPDPSLFAGGLHEIVRGGRFDLHTDFNAHPVTRLANRLVFITYLNRDWRPEYGGVLQLWDVREGRCVREIVPEFGRSILFAHGATSMHGHPDPVSGPQPRRSLAAYFYTNGETADDEPAHTTRFLPGRKPQFGRWGRTIVIANYVSPMVVDGVRFLYRQTRRLGRDVR
jgi:hypothetical protein